MQLQFSMVKAEEKQTAFPCWTAIESL